MADGKELKNYQNAIEKALTEKYPGFTIKVFKSLQEEETLPAIVVNKPVLEPKDPTMQIASKFRTAAQLNIFVVYSAADEDNEIECLQQSANLAKFINKNLFGERTPATVSLVEPVFEEGLEEYFIQRIDFEQTIEIVSDN
ncbi:TPA: hypothetical protein CPT87_07125 [Candidatus Gastranaerophilales bacterium HUM_5]|jgi:hypothetical protein|nr:MAG TPA: hypothetical protein CPT99_09940 [Candidatus Gastranaerophilales bacterium HUM_4]DAA90980.1 MAG TPA: hypothetical protein CPT87_07125 [Candidatus Gastranaerophilales bacterium HUM_5]